MCTYEEALEANGSKWRHWKRMEANGGNESKWKLMAVGEFEKKVKNAN